MTLNAGMLDAHYHVWARKDKNLMGSWDPVSNVRGGGIRPPGVPGGARVITLTPGEILFRWASTHVPDPSASPWWSSKRASQGILRDTYRDAADYQTLDTSGVARSYSGVARSWSNLGKVILLRVVAPVCCFIGMGKPVEDDLMVGDDKVTTQYAEQLQIYIPNMVEWDASAGRTKRTGISQSYFAFVGLYGSDEFSSWQWSSATGLRF